MLNSAGYARCSTDRQDLTAQKEILISLGVPEDRIDLDQGLTGTNRERPGLGQALALPGRRARRRPHSQAAGDLHLSASG